LKIGREYTAVETGGSENRFCRDGDLENRLLWKLKIGREQSAVKFEDRENTFLWKLKIWRKMEFVRRICCGN
jgi:hypothetical protein